jgi:hypothetical protein
VHRLPVLVGRDRGVLVGRALVLLGRALDVEAHDHARGRAAGRVLDGRDHAVLRVDRVRRQLWRKRKLGRLTGAARRAADRDDPDLIDEVSGRLVDVQVEVEARCPRLDGDGVELTHGAELEPAGRRRFIRRRRREARIRVARDQPRLGHDDTEDHRREPDLAVVDSPPGSGRISVDQVAVDARARRNRAAPRGEIGRAVVLARPRVRLAEGEARISRDADVERDRRRRRVILLLVEGMRALRVTGVVVVLVLVEGDRRRGRPLMHLAARRSDISRCHHRKGHPDHGQREHGQQAS